MGALSGPLVPVVMGDGQAEWMLLSLKPPALATSLVGRRLGSIERVN